jgi:hypothetical protein
MSRLALRTGFVVALAALLTADRAGADGFIEHIAPPALERGTTTRVRLVGRDLDRALTLWSSLPAGALSARPIESSSEAAVFDVTVSPDAPVGLCGLRMASEHGLSNAHLFLIDDLPVRPRGDDSKPMAVRPPTSLWGILRPATMDRYVIDVAAGERLSIEVVANRFGKDADPLVTLRDARGTWLAEHDNDAGLGFDTRFAHTFAQAGPVTIEVRDARFHGSEHFPYLLRLGRFPAARVALPSAVAPGTTTLTLPEAQGPPASVTVPPEQLPGPFTAALRRPDDNASTIWRPTP